MAKLKRSKWALWAILLTGCSHTYGKVCLSAKIVGNEINMKIETGQVPVKIFTEDDQ